MLPKPFRRPYLSLFCKPLPGFSNFFRPGCLRPGFVFPVCVRLFKLSLAPDLESLTINVGLRVELFAMHDAMWFGIRPNRTD